MRVVVVNAKGGQADGTALAWWLHRLKPRWKPLVALISEIDAPEAVQDRVVVALRSRLRRARLYQGSETHGAREVAVLIWGRVKVLSAKSYQLTDGHGWDGAEQDRWATVVRCKYRRRRVAFISTHASTTEPESIQPALHRIVTGLRAGGYAIVLGGDLNQRYSRSSTWLKWASAHRFMSATTLVMWALTKGVTRHDVAALPLTDAISDHDTALSVTVKVR